MKLLVSLLFCLIGFHSVLVAQQTTNEGSSTIPAAEKTPANEFTTMSLAELQQQAESGNGKAQNELAYRYRFGSGGVEKDKAKSVEWLRKAAASGIVVAYFNLGAAYYNGDGVAISDDQSCKWFILARDAGVANSQEAVERAKGTFSAGRFHDCELLVATAYLGGKEIRKDYARAMQLYKKLADEGDGRASERVAVMYDHGWGVPPDAKESIALLERACGQKDSLALYELGRLYEGGISVPQDYSKARKLYEASSNGLMVPAIVALSKMYRDGRGVKVNLETAYMWAFLAGDRLGSAEGKSLAESISGQLKKKQIESAKKEAHQHVAGQIRYSYKP